MFFVGILGWWYSAGWRQRVAIVKERLVSTLDYFSLDILVSTLFSPFRQISAGKVTGPLAIQIRAFFDLLISRVIGACIRIMILFVGVIAILFQVLYGGLILIGWLLIPALPFIGVLLFSLGLGVSWIL